MQNIFPNIGFARRRRSASRTGKQRGQSLVELALTTPILLLIMAGTVEVTNLLTIYNELQAATREAGRLASQGSPDANLWSVFAQSLTDTPINPSNPDLLAWVVRPSIKDCSSICNNGFKNGSTYTWGVSEYCMNPAGCNGLDSPVTADMVWNGLKKGNNNDFSSYSDQTFAVVVASYNAPTLLNLKLNLFGAQWGRDDGKFPMYTYIVFRQEVSSQTASDLAGGCSAYPIALDFKAIDPVLYRAGANPFPLTLGTGFYFVGWNSSVNSTGALTGPVTGQPIGSMVSPGTSQQLIPTGNTGGFYKNPFDTTNFQLRRDDWVLEMTGATSLTPLTTVLNDDKATERTLRVIIFQRNEGVGSTSVPYPTKSLGGGFFQNPGLKNGSGQILNPNPSGPETIIQIDDFAVVKIASYSTATNTVNFSYVGASESCGYPQQ